MPDVLNCTRAKSVIDIGCATGAWLSIFADNGIEDLLGVDSNAIPIDMLEIPVKRFVAFDLAQPYRSSRRFDLVVSLEVAEHLPAAAAEPFVESLVRLGPAVLFSAAIPGQGGTHHLNEQWQDYWAGLFDKRDCLPVDLVRRSVWQNKEVAWWYAQNTFSTAERNYALSNPILIREVQTIRSMPLAIVHPRKFEEANWHARLARGALELARVMPLARLLSSSMKPPPEMDLIAAASLFHFRKGWHFRWISHGRPKRCGANAGTCSRPPLT